MTGKLECGKLEDLQCVCLFFVLRGSNAGYSRRLFSMIWELGKHTISH